MFVGQPLITGASLSSTVTVNEHCVAALPAASLTLYVTVVVPTGNVAPGVCEPVGVRAPSQLSFAVGGVHVTTALHTPASLG